MIVPILTLPRQAPIVPPQQRLDVFWSPQTITQASGVPPGSRTAYAGNVERYWPMIAGELSARGIYDRDVAAAAIATIAIESASTFAPVREAHYLYPDDPDAVHEYLRTWKISARYWPYYGRGWVQLTWRENYLRAGMAIDVDLVANPELAMLPRYAAQILAWYFETANVYSPARIHNWPEVRRRVQGGYAELDRLTAIAERLLAS